MWLPGELVSGCSCHLAPAQHESPGLPGVAGVLVCLVSPRPVFTPPQPADLSSWHLGRGRLGCQGPTAGGSPGRAGRGFCPCPQPWGGKHAAAYGGGQSRAHISWLLLLLEDSQRNFPAAPEEPRDPGQVVLVSLLTLALTAQPTLTVWGAGGTGSQDRPWGSWRMRILRGGRRWDRGPLGLSVVSGIPAEP